MSLSSCLILNVIDAGLESRVSSIFLAKSCASVFVSADDLDLA